MYIEYMNISRQPAATGLMIDIKHQPDRVLIDIRYQTSNFNRTSVPYHYPHPQYQFSHAAFMFH